MFSMSEKFQKGYKIHSHGCLTDFPDWPSITNPISHTETKAREVNPKKIST